MSPNKYDPCKRGCCWSPFSGVCATRRNCACHSPTLAAWLGAQEPAPENVAPIRRHKDPTGETAARNVDRERKRRK